MMNQSSLHRWLSIARQLAFAYLLLAASRLRAADVPAGFTPLFNDRDLSGWRGGITYDPRQLRELPDAERHAKIAAWTAALTKRNDKTGKPHWRVVDGELVNDGSGGYVTTEKDYGDFELRLEYKMAPQADAGIYLRGIPQVQIGNPARPDPQNAGLAKGSGGLWNNPPGSPGRDQLVLADRPPGEWNRVRILMLGSRVSVWLNDRLVVDHAILENYFDRELPPERRRPIPARGPIQLQTHGGEIRWRNPSLREIGSDEAGDMLARRGVAGYQFIFNGRDLADWAGAVDAVEIKDRVLVWRKGKGGNTLYWNRELKDFQARVRFKIPPGGNNGLAIRYPGTGLAAYDGMCELQIYDDSDERTKTMDPRQAHGSAYGMAAAVRGYQHPPGEWNFQEVTVRGSRLTVELNGTVILDADLGRVDPATMMNKRPHVGRTRTSGFFGFAGHSDPVMFKDIMIKQL